MAARLRVRCPFLGVDAMNLGTVLLIILVLVLVGALPRWSYSTNWGYYPSGTVSVVLVVVVVLLLLGRL
jgi:MFS superfamily sulfate permease-like transporter